MNRSNLGQASETNSTSASPRFGLYCGLAITTKLSHLTDEHRFAIANVAVRSAFKPNSSAMGRFAGAPSKGREQPLLTRAEVARVTGSLRMLFSRIGQAAIRYHFCLDMNAGSTRITEFHKFLNREFDFTNILSTLHGCWLSGLALRHHRLHSWFGRYIRQHSYSAEG